MHFWRWETIPYHNTTKIIPDDYFEDIEKTYIDPKNPFVEEFQVLAMACDKPISKHELKEHQEVIEQHIIKENLASPK